MPIVLAAILASSDFEPPAPRWPGITSMWLAGASLTVATGIGASTSICIACGGKTFPTAFLERTSALVAGGVGGLLLGLMWQVWMQPADEPKPYSPGATTLATGLAEIAGGAIRTLFVPRFGPESTQQYHCCAVIIGSGIAALAAGVAWLIWAAR